MHPLASKISSYFFLCSLRNFYVTGRSELEAMLQKGVKFEIEALSACSISFLSEEYIPQKIKQGIYKTDHNASAQMYS
jgi:meiotic recombination protein SPO11